MSISGSKTESKTAEVPKNVAMARPAGSRRGNRRDLEQGTDWVNGAVYGPFGAGKTYLMGTCELVKDMNTVLLVNVDFGVKGLPKDFRGDILNITSYAQLAEVYKFAYAYQSARDNDDVEKMCQLEAKLFKEPIEYVRERGPARYRTIIIDDLVDIFRLLKYQLLGIDLETIDLAKTPDYMEMRDWGTALEMILIFLSKFRLLRFHKLVVMSETEDEDGNRKVFRPGLQGQAKTEILGFFDFVGYLTMITPQAKTGKEFGVQEIKHEVIRRLYIAPVGPFKAKGRFSKMPKDSEYWFDNPTMVDLYNAL